MDRGRLRRRRRRAVCRWARRLTNGPTAMWTRGLRMRPWFWTKRLPRRTPVIRRSSLAPRWPIGKTAKCSFTWGHKARCRRLAGLGRWLNMDPDQIVLISEYTGGGFGSKATGYIFAIIPALLSKKANAPVMMRISREEEHFIGRARPGFQGRMKVGFSKDGRITALDMFAICNNGPYDAQGDADASGRIVSLLYQPPAMRWRGVTMLTNTPPRGPQSAPGGMQGIIIMEPILAKAARKLALDQVDIRQDQLLPKAKLLRAAEETASGGTRPARSSRKRSIAARSSSSGKNGSRVRKRSGTKVRGVGVSSSAFFAGSTGYDGLIVIRPDGRIAIQSGIGNLGTESISDVHRVVAEVLGVPWEKCDVTWGNTSQEPAVDLRFRWQPDDARHDTSGTRRGDGCETEAAGDCRQDLRRQTGAV